MILVFRFGLIGVAIGTLASMLIRTVQYIRYYYVNLIEDKTGITFELKRLIVSLMEILIYVIVSLITPSFNINSYVSWFIYSIIVGIFCVLVVMVFSFLFFKDQCKDLLYIIRNLISKRNNWAK